MKAELEDLLANFARRAGAQSGSRHDRDEPSRGRFSVSTAVRLPFDRTLRETVRALKEKDLIIITEIDLQAQLAVKLNRQIRPCSILGVWSPSWEYEALRHEPDIGLLRPSQVCGWDNGEGTCTFADLKHLCHVEEDLALAQAARAVNTRLRPVVSSMKTPSTARIRVESSRKSGGKLLKSAPARSSAAKPSMIRPSRRSLRNGAKLVRC